MRWDGNMADIIVVEDNDEIGLLLQDFLTAAGYDILNRYMILRML